MKRANFVAFAFLAGAGAACGHGAGDEARYPERAAGCAVRRFPEQPTIAVDDLGPVQVECVQNGIACERQLLDRVCAAGGDVAWGLSENALSATTLAAHAAHSKRLAPTARERGCDVRVSDNAPPAGAENVGTVVAFCSADDPQDTCMRELKDQVCLLGGDFLWQVEGPSPYGDKQRLRGRAAHLR